MNISFEFFPPQTNEGCQNLVKVRAQLGAIKPEYFSVTFGARGTIQDATLKTVLDIQADNRVAVAPHLSCIGTRQQNIVNLLDQYQAANINRAVILRGDIPSDARDIGDFHHANELVAFIKSRYGDGFHIEVAAYPEKHPEAENIQSDLDYFINKIKAGADGAITQYFYNADAYFRFVDEAQKAGVDVPITPGIMPITNYAQLLKFSKFCGAEIPKWILERMKLYENNLESLAKFGTEVVSELCQTLKNQGVANFHFYSMNRTEPSLSIAKNLL